MHPTEVLLDTSVLIRCLVPHDDELQPAADATRAAAEHELSGYDAAFLAVALDDLDPRR